MNLGYFYVIPKNPEIDPGIRFLNPESRDWKSSPETTIPNIIAALNKNVTFY